MKNNGRKYHLAAVIVGNDGASLTYVGSKVKACQRVVLNLLWLNYQVPT
jgi:methylenetetrahydrofolate dehydrogenase (NADP+)/methenyltetrahydrofolate cyclohydrolase